MAKYFLMVLSLMTIAVWAAVVTLPDNNLHIVVCDVGQGDAILIQRLHYQMLIDSGVGNRVMGCLGKYVPFYDRKIEVVMFTHPDADHIGGGVGVLEAYDVETVVMSVIGKETTTYRELIQAIAQENSQVVNTFSGDGIKFGGMTFDVAWPTHQFVADNTLEDQSLAVADSKVLGLKTIVADTNEYSVGGILTYGDFDMMFTGDADLGILDDQIKTGKLRDVELLKVPHHGSKYGMTPEWLLAITPELAVISVGKNSYGHPTQEAIKLLSDRAIKILRTDEMGDVGIVSDGKKWWVE